MRELHIAQRDHLMLPDALGQFRDIKVNCDETIERAISVQPEGQDKICVSCWAIKKTRPAKFTYYIERMGQ